MIYVLAVIAAMMAAVVGWFVTGVIAGWVAGLYGMSDFEGGRGMFAFLFVGPLGGLVSMIVAAWLVVRVGKGQAPVLPTLGRIGLVLSGIALVIAAGVLVLNHSVDIYTNELPPQLVFEMRVPMQTSVPPREEMSVELHTDKNVGSGQLFSDWSLTGDYKVIHGGVDLAFKTAGRFLVISFPNQPTRLYRLPLSRDPSSTETLSEWHHADHLDEHDGGALHPPPANDPVEVRYRVRRAGE